MQNDKKIEASSLEELTVMIETHRAQKMLEAVLSLGFNFKCQEEVETFKRERITVAIDEGRGRYIVLDYQKPDQTILAYYSDHPEEVDDKIVYPDWYYEGPDE